MLRNIKPGMLFLSIAYLFLGVFLLIRPYSSLNMICLLFGAVVLATGIGLLLRYFYIRGNGILAPFVLVGGVVSSGLGIFALLSPDTVASILPVVFGLFICVDGIMRLGSTVQLAKKHVQRWWVLMLLAFVSVALGVFLVIHPLDVAQSVVMLCGVLLIVEGAMNLCCTIYTAMELHALERLDAATTLAANAAAGEIADALDEAIEQQQMQNGTNYPVIAAEVTGHEVEEEAEEEPTAEVTESPSGEDEKNPEE